MDTVLVKINNEKAYKLLEGLEDLQVITVLKKNIEPKQKLSDELNATTIKSLKDAKQGKVTKHKSVKEMVSYLNK